MVPSPSKGSERLTHTKKYQKIISDDGPHRLPRSVVTPDQVQHLKPCRWAWCRLTFVTNSQLVSHVVNHHIQTAVPIRRKDVPLYKRFEEGVGESLSMSGLDLPNLGHHSLDEINVKCNGIEEPTSSLPSPPATSPPSHSIASGDDEESPAAPQRSMLYSETGGEKLLPPNTVDGGESTAFKRLQTPPSPSPLIPHADNTAPEQTNPTTRLQTPPSSALFSSSTQNSAVEQSNQSKRLRNPSFASLSSPIDSQSMYANPSTPTFSSLVESAINEGTSRQAGHDRASNPPAPPTRTGSQSSQSSTNSHDSVKQQLAQDTSGEEDHENYPDSQRSSPRKALHTPNNAFSGLLGGRPTLQVTSSLSGQAWYGTRPVRRVASLSSPLGDVSPISRTPIQWATTTTHSQPSKQVAHYDSNMTKLHSGTSNTAPSEPEVLSPEQSQVCAAAESQSQSQGGFSDYSYGPLQTQAPYRSQSFSQ